MSEQNEQRDAFVTDVQIEIEMEMTSAVSALYRASDCIDSAASHLLAARAAGGRGGEVDTPELLREISQRLVKVAAVIATGEGLAGPDRSSHTGGANG